MTLKRPSPYPKIKWYTDTVDKQFRVEVRFANQHTEIFYPKYINPSLSLYPRREVFLYGFYNVEETLKHVEEITITNRPDTMEQCISETAQTAEFHLPESQNKPLEQ